MSEPTGKRCTKCGEVKPLEEFNRSQRSRDGRQTRCRTCINRHRRERHAADPEVRREQGRRWRAANPEVTRKLRRQGMRRWAAANPETVRERNSRWHASYRTRVLDHYGHQCACCGTTESLTIDHVNGDGRQHREEIGSTAIYRWLIRNGFPSGYQVLCLACNSSKGTGSRCLLSHRTA